jgi:hypothetical protein
MRRLYDEIMGDRGSSVTIILRDRVNGQEKGQAPGKRLPSKCEGSSEDLEVKLQSQL